MGMIVDKTNTKYGKCRPYLALGILPCCILMIGLFALPDGMKPGAKTILAIAAYGLFSVLFAFMNVPYSTMINVLTASNSQRISLNLYKTLGATPGAVFVTAFSLKAVEYFAKGSKNGFPREAALVVLLFLTENGTSYQEHPDRNGKVPDDARIDYIHTGTFWRRFFPLWR